MDLFHICLKYDSMKIALDIYLKHITVQDVHRPLLTRFIDTLAQSVKFHEIKLFFILEHFDVMDIEQLNDLVDVL